MSDTSPLDTTTRGSNRLSTALLAVTLVAIVTAGVASAQVAVTGGTVFEAGNDGPTVEIAQNLTLDSPYKHPDAHTVDLAPYATFESTGATNVTVESVDGAWTNLTTHDISVGLAVDSTDKQNVTLEGENVSYVNVSAIDDGDRSSTELVYGADSPLNVTLTELSASESIELLAADGSVLRTVSTDENGTAIARLPAGEKRLTVAVETGDGSSGGGGVDPNDPPDATDDSYAVVANGTLSVTADDGVLATDSDPDDDRPDLSATGQSGPASGTLSLASNGSFTYAPDDGFVGTDSFTYEVSDGDGGADTATVTVTVTTRTNDGSGPRVIENESAIRQQLDVPESATPLAAERVSVSGNETGHPTANFTDHTSVASVQFTTDTSGNLTVVEYTDPPSTYGTVPGTSLVPLQIDGSPALENATAIVRMRVSRTNLRSTDVDATDVRIAHRVDGNWELSNTTIVSRDDEAVRLEATTDGFSPFAITAVEPPNASVAVTPTPVRVGEELTLDASDATTPDGTIASYEWSVDGQSLSGETATVRLEDAGEYTVELTVTTDAGRTSTASTSVVVEPGTRSATTPDERPSQTPDGSTQTDPSTPPSSGADTSTGTTVTENGPGFGISLTLGVLVAIALVARKRRR